MLSECFLGQWTDEASRAAKEHPITERDGWRCAVPICTRRSNFQVHHPKFRSQGGDNSPENLSNICTEHHQGCIHRGHVRVTGKAPGQLEWDIGVDPNGRPLLRIRGQEIVGVAA